MSDRVARANEVMVVDCGATRVARAYKPSLLIVSCELPEAAAQMFNDARAERLYDLVLLEVGLAEEEVPDLCALLAPPARAEAIN